jgi:trimethylamine--corrinoid protein Co-methyltransferase
MCKRIKRGEDITEDRLGLDLIEAVGPGGEYLTQNHTFRNFRSEFYRPAIEERGNFAGWQSNGGLAMEQRANSRWKEILANFTEPGLPGEVDRDLRDYIDKI